MGLAISVFGLGYVGSVTAACFAHMGHRVMGVDVNPLKVEMLESGRSPIVEAQMNEMVAETNRACRLHATADAASAVCNSEISFVCVGTPSLANGRLDLSHIERVTREIGAALRGKRTHHWVVVRSTLLPGTTESVVVPLLEECSGRRAGADFSVCYNPEFMREGSAVSDFLHPAHTILGSKDPACLVPLRQLYQETSAPLFETSIPVAEMVKYVSNSFHALKVSFANEIGTLCKQMGVDTQAVTNIFASDTRLNISPAYLTPGFAFGGSCLPKDLRALAYKAKQLDLGLPLLSSILPSNLEHIQRAVDMVLATGKKKISLLGLSFKSGTDDLRESPQVLLIKRLLGEGCQVQVWDQDVTLGRLAGANRQYIEEVIPHIGSLLSADLAQVVSEAQVVIIGTKSARSEDLACYLLPNQTVIDLVNLDASRRPSAPAFYEGICWS